MSRFSLRALGIALPITLMSQAAMADLTPKDVWGDWRAYMEGMGYKIDATEAASGDNLTVSDINLNFDMPENEGKMSLSMGTVNFVQNSDGTVSIVLPDTLPMKMTGNDGTPGGEPFSMTMNYAQTDHAMTVSGSPEKMTYLYTAGTIAMDLTQMMIGDEALGRDFAKISVKGGSVNSTTTMTIGETRGYEQTGSIATLAYDAFFKSPEADEPEVQANVTGNVNGVSMSGTGVIPLTMTQGADIRAMLAAGFDVIGKISYTDGTSNFDVKDTENGNYVLKTASNGGEFGVEMGANGLTYDVAQRDVKINVTAEVMPFPIDFAMAESGFNLTMPVSKSEEPQDFAFGLKMGDFTMSDMIWGMFDPTSQLPRDPATVIVDLTGKVKILVDFLNPEAAAEMTGAPGEMQALKLGNLLVSAAGAKLEGAGDITFDGSGPAMVPGVGNPVGNINLALAGGNGLLDKLVALGFLPSDQAMGARMMMGLFAVPGDAPDTLKSQIEFTQDGQILANGQRIR